MIYKNKCEIRRLGGSPALFVNGKAVPAVAYLSYLKGRAEYKAFADAGCRLFSLPVYFAGRTINTETEISPFRKGIFDDPEKPFWEELDSELDEIIRACPDALIFPRVNLAMPLAWEQNHPGELNRLADGRFCRESFFSDVWLEDVKKLLRTFLSRLASTKYVNNIIGYHIADGMTEEWFGFNWREGDFGEAARRGFNRFLKERYPDEAESIADLPDFSAYGNKEYSVSDPAVIRYCEYINCRIAYVIRSIAAFVKECTGREALTGVFYGYTLEVINDRSGSHCLKDVLNCRDIDFISSPVTYTTGREPGTDVSYMSVFDSQRLHGKLYMAENDNRTFLTRLIKDCRENACPPGTYEIPIWLGPESKSVTRGVLANAFSRNLTHGAGFWWFDMWGGWYSDSDIMADMKLFNEIASEALTRPSRECDAQYAVIASEASYKYINPECFDAFMQCCLIRGNIGKAGAPYDVYDIYDLEALPEKYKAVIFLGISGFEARAFAYAAEHQKTRFLFTGERNYRGYTAGENVSFCGFFPSAAQIRDFLGLSGVHIYICTEDVIHAGGGYLALHTASAGKKRISLPAARLITPLYPKGEAFTSDVIEEEVDAFETRLYRLDI